MKAYVLMTQRKDGDPGISGVFSSFGKQAHPGDEKLAHGGRKGAG